MTSGVPLAVCWISARAKEVSSRSARPMPMTNSSDVSLISSTNSLVSGGMMIRNACGSTTETVVHSGDMPSERAASSCPFGTAWMPARNVSAMYAAATMIRASRPAPICPPGTRTSNAIGMTNAMAKQRREAAEDLDVDGCDPPVGRDG